MVASRLLQTGPMRRKFDALEHVSDWYLFAFAALWVILGGLMLQLVLLPYVYPGAHAGHGLIADQDSVGFHRAAEEVAQAIRTDGWDAWRPREVGYSIAVASAVYALTVPEPWAVLPVNGVLLGTTMVAVRHVLTIMFDSRAVALVALLPFFVFPSFVPIWGQLHRDLNTGAGFCLVLCGLALSTRSGRGSSSLGAAAAISVVGMVVVSFSRSYAMMIIAAGAAAFAACALLGRHAERLRIVVVAAAVVVSAAASLQDWSTRFTPSNIIDSPAPPIEAGDDSVSSAKAAGRRTVELCLPPPAPVLWDRLLYNLCYVREGFVQDSTRFGAASGYDFDIRLRTASDFIAYTPRALERGLIEPGPWRWMTETTPIGRLGSYWVPFEMLVAYASILFAATIAYRRLARAQVWAVLAFCLVYVLVYVLATSQLGTLYRMRAFAFTTIVSTALAAIVAHLRAPE